MKQRYNRFGRSNCLLSSPRSRLSLAMAPNRLLQGPPAASSTDEDAETDEEEEEEVQNQNDVVESGDEEEDEDDDDEEEEENVDAKKPIVPNAKLESASDDDDGDGNSETESDDMNHSPSASDFTVKPIISKPAAPAKKRAAAEIDSNLRDSKKKRAANSSGGDDKDTKKGQLWGKDDEIAILEGMIEFKKRGTDPSSNMGAFHEFLKKSLKVDVSKNQLVDKARRLKKKYRTNAAKGEDAVFAKAHELKSFELSKRIWGEEANGLDDGEMKPRRKSVEVDSDKKNPKTVLALPASDSAEKRVVRNNVEKKVEVNVANGGVKAEAELEEFWNKYPNLSESLRVGSGSGLERVVSQSLPSIGSSKAKGLDDKWRKLQVLEMELAVKKLDLIHEQAKLALEVMKSRKD